MSKEYALGASYIAHEIQKVLVATSGVNKKGDVAVGTGVHVHMRYVVTCDHVISDKKVDSRLMVGGRALSVIDHTKLGRVTGHMPE